MYEDYYSLHRLPFQLTPDQRFFFDGRPHKRAVSCVAYGLSRNEGFIVITGEIGAGKTTLIDYLLARIGNKAVRAAKINTTQLEGDNLLRMVLSAFRLPFEGVDKATLLRRLEDFLVEGRGRGAYSLLIVDEVQNLSHEAIEDLRMLSNFQDGERPLLQILLAGQPQFKEILAREDLEQLRQRIIASYHLTPLDAAETRRYIEHRLRQAGWDGREIFAEDGYDLIYQETGGLPRKINRLCDRLLLYGFIEETSPLRRRDILEVLHEMGQELPTGGGAPNGSEASHAAEASVEPRQMNGGAAPVAAAPEALREGVDVLDHQLEALRPRLDQHRAQLGTVLNRLERSPGNGAG
ncbi:MAG TPA: XrtA/PEP-CTERM system-associated ATPase [Alphaproteobacteria bacterium]|nr:XrtA/PEP-CTERM system-associated ATPase [Alphaproteobacteria bacterium]